MLLRLRLQPCMLQGVTDVDMSVRVLGERISMPLGVAPMGLQRMVIDDGELATVRGGYTIVPRGGGVGLPWDYNKWRTMMESWPQ